MGAYWFATLPDDNGLAGLWRGARSCRAGSGRRRGSRCGAGGSAGACRGGREPAAPAGEATPACRPRRLARRIRRSFLDRGPRRDAESGFVGEYPAGTRQNVEGKAPFQLWIGRASAVRVFMGERSIDLKPHTREEVARFSLE
jgi:hypothetical protein